MAEMKDDDDDSNCERDRDGSKGKEGKNDEFLFLAKETRAGPHGHGVWVIEYWNEDERENGRYPPLYEVALYILSINSDVVIVVTMRTR